MDMIWGAYKNYNALKNLVVNFVVIDECISSEGLREDALIINISIDLNKLVQLGFFDLGSLDSLPINAVFLTTDTGYWVTDKLYSIISSSIPSSTLRGGGGLHDQDEHVRAWVGDLEEGGEGGALLI